MLPVWFSVYQPLRSSTWGMPEARSVASVTTCSTALAGLRKAAKLAGGAGDDNHGNPACKEEQTRGDHRASKLFVSTHKKVSIK